MVVLELPVLFLVPPSLELVVVAAASAVERQVQVLTEVVTAQPAHPFLAVTAQQTQAAVAVAVPAELPAITAETAAQASSFSNFQTFTPQHSVQVSHNPQHLLVATKPAS
jgi:hypothetical protein